jgi:serine/threonine-protein kinase
MAWTGPFRRAFERLKAWPRRRRVALWAGGFATAFLGGYAIAALVLFPAPIFASATGVPRVLGMSRADAERTLTDAGLGLGDVDERTHPTARRGSVVWQDPPPEVVVPPRAAVDLTVSTGAQRVPVPDLTGYDAALAGQLVVAAGLVIRAVDSTQAPVPRGVVVNTRPPAGAALTPGSGVTLVVSVGAPTITVPSLISLTALEAEYELELVGLMLGTSIRRTSNAGPPGTIIEQSPAPGTLSSPGTAVNITVAR